jgi:hypothetical protein
MSRELLDDYARLLTLDSRACAALFARDAEFNTRLGSHDLCLRGRHEIHDFLEHVPRQVRFQAIACEETDADPNAFRAEILVLPDGLPSRTQSVHFRVEAGRITRFDVDLDEPDPNGGP